MPSARLITAPGSQEGIKRREGNGEKKEKGVEIGDACGNEETRRGGARDVGASAGKRKIWKKRDRGKDRGGGASTKRRLMQEEEEEEIHRRERLL